MGQMWEIKRIFVIFLVMIFLSSSLMGFATGDGGIFGKMGEYFYIDENSQYAVTQL